jgi:hypothetical protein
VDALLWACVRRPSLSLLTFMMYVYYYREPVKSTVGSMGVVERDRPTASTVSTLGPERPASVVRSRERQPVLGNVSGGS